MAEINVGLIGHQFMGKAHSNAWRQVARFFPGKLTPRDPTGGRCWLWIRA